MNGMISRLTPADWHQWLMLSAQDKARGRPNRNILRRQDGYLIIRTRPGLSNPLPPSGGGGPFTADVWVAKAADGGSDSNDGLSIDTPKLTINAGLAILSSGQTMAVRRGTYNENITQSGIPAGGGTWETATQIVAYPGDPVGSVVLQATNNNAFYSSNENWITITGINYINGLTIGNSSHHIRLVQCDVVGPGGPNALLIENTSSFNEFHSCRIHDSDGHAIYISSGNNLWDHCEIDNSGQNPPVSTSGFGFHFYNSGTYSVSDNTVRYCLIHDCLLTGLMFSNGTGNVAYNNIFYHNGLHATESGHGIRISLNADNSLIYHNTVYNTGTGGGGGLGILIETADCSNTDVRNNISYNNVSGDYSDSGTSTTHSNNLDDGTNPSFVNAGAANFHLNSGSPARNIGANLLATVPDDYDGVSRDSLPDAGAFEFV